MRALVRRRAKPPDLVLEVASRSTWRRDYGAKRAIYEALGVREYFVFDARPGERGRLTGLRLERGAYTPIEPVPVVLGGVGVPSAVLGLVARSWEGDDRWEMRWHDPASGKDLRNYDEMAAMLEERDRDVAASKAEIAALCAALDGRTEMGGLTIWS